MTDDQIIAPAVVPDDAPGLETASETDNGYLPGEKDVDTDSQGWYVWKTAEELAAEKAFPSVG